MSKRGSNVRFALVPYEGCVCEVCLMQGSRGFVFSKEFNPHGGKNMKCKCEFMPGIKGETRIDGYNPEGCLDKWESVVRIKKELAPDIDRLSEEQKTRVINSIYIAESKGIEFSRVAESNKIEIDYSRTPRENYGTLKKELPGLEKYDESNFATKGNEWRDLFAHDILSNHGFSVLVRRSEALGVDGAIIDGLTLIDVELNGILYEIKSITGTNIGRIIEARMKETVRRNFSNPYDDLTMQRYSFNPEPRMILNTKYCEADEMDAFEHVPKRMINSELVDVLIVLQNGNVYRFMKH